jgi:hypothetical protein
VDNIQSRIKSPVFWATTILTVLGLVTASGLITSDVALKVIGVVGGTISAVFGIANNPTNPDGF